MVVGGGGAAADIGCVLPLLLPLVLVIVVIIMVVSWLKFGLEDPRVVGVFPFYWPGGTRNPDGSITGGAGISDLPKVSTIVEKIRFQAWAKAEGLWAAVRRHLPGHGASDQGKPEHLALASRLT